MQKTTFATGLAAALLLGAGSALATPNLFSDPAHGSLGVSITVSDQNYTGNANIIRANDPTLGSNGPGGYGNHEDQETETNPNTLTTQVWDLEGMYQRQNNLTLVGGFNYKTGVNYGGYTYRGGDIFIDNTGDAFYGSTNKDMKTAANGIGNTGTTNTTNCDGWDYVIHFDTDGATGTYMNTYSVYAIDKNTVVSRVMDVPSSNPFRYVSGGTLVTTGGQVWNHVAVNGSGTFGKDNSLSTYHSVAQGEHKGLQGDGTTSGANNTHYYLTVDISFLPVGFLNTFHYTVECGNDNLVGKGKTVQVPESVSTAALLGGALLGLFGLRRKFRR